MNFKAPSSPHQGLIHTSSIGLLTEFASLMHLISFSSAFGKFTVIYATFTPLEIFKVHFDCASSQNLLGPARAGAFLDCALVALAGTFSDLVITFVAGAKETLCFGGPKSTFCGSEQFYLRRRRSSEHSDFAAGALNPDLWTRGSF